MPQESFGLSFAYTGELRKDVKEIRDSSNTAATAANRASAAADAAADAAQGLQTTFNNVIGDKTKPRTLANQVDQLAEIDFATKQDIERVLSAIAELQSLICCCWWHDVGWVYLDRAATDSIAAKVFDQAGLRDETRRSAITAEKFKKAAAQHEMQYYLPTDSHFDKLLQFLKNFKGKPPPRRSAGRS